MTRTTRTLSISLLAKDWLALAVLATTAALVPVLGDSADSVVVFNEIQYQPSAETNQPEWIELHNMMGVTVDLSGWQFEGAGNLTFAEGTKIPGRGFLLLSNRPDDPLFAERPVYAQALTGRLANEGDTLRLRNRSGRLMDRLRYRNGPGWPVGPAGSGATLAKRNERSAETGPENWIASSQMGGTPGRRNAPLHRAQEELVTLISDATDWHFYNTGREAPPEWKSPQIDPANWPTGHIPFRAGNATEPVQTTGPFASWKFDEAEGRVTSEGSSGTESRLMNGVNWVMDSERGWVLEFDGLDGYVDTGIDIPKMTLANDFTWAFWGFSRKTANVNVILGNRYRADGADFSPREFIKFTNGGLEFHRQGSGEDILYPPIPRNDWVHHAVVKKGISLTYYRNGSVLGRQQLSSGLNNPQPLYFGGDRTHENWRGRLDDVGLWEVALDAATIAHLADGTHSPESAPAAAGMSTGGAGTELAGVSATAYFLTEFIIAGNPSLTELLMHLAVDDGAVIYLNDEEVYRFNVNDGPLPFDALAMESNPSVDVNKPISIPSNSLRSGRNVMAVEVHQATSFLDSEDLLFGLTLQGRERQDEHPHHDNLQFNEPPQVIESSIVINEIMYHPTEANGKAVEAGPWIELLNRGQTTVDLSNWRLDDGLAFTFPNQTELGPGQFLLIVEDRRDFETVYPDSQVVLGEWSGTLSRRSERLRLLDALGNQVDELKFYDGGRWPTQADGGGSSLELRDPRADNQSPEAWAASSTAGTWHEVSYRGRGVNPQSDPTRYQEFVLGLLNEGEFLIDDISVLENPDGAARELIQNGDFESDSTAFWRSLGNHNDVRVITDPEKPGNKVLRVIATGSTEHMSNHLETTLRSEGSYVRVSEQREYQISFRAKWVVGSNQLHSRLYFNRLARTTLLPTTYAGGSPGSRNTTYQSNVGPTFKGLSHSPAVPAPREPATVQIVAHDPDGIAGLTLHYSVRNGHFNSVPMQLSNQLWSASIPGQEHGAKIQFYVEALDGRGVRSQFPAEGENSAAFIPISDGQADLDYGDCQPMNLRIVMKSEDIHRLHSTANVMSNERLGCTVVIDEHEVYYGAGIRLKGSEHGRASDLRVGYNIRFPAEHRFLGAHDTIAIDRSGAGDQFSQREIMVKHAINHAGDIPGSYDDLIRVIAPRPQHTGSAILSKSRFDREYLVNQFTDGNQGSLYEYELIYVLSSTDGGVEGLKLTQPGEVHGVQVRNLNSNDKERYRWHWLLKNNRDQDDFSPIIRMLSAMGQTGNRYRRDTDQLLDVDQWLRAFAIQVLFGIADNYASGSQHNAMFYQRPSDGKMLYFPWDMDFTFVRGASSSLIPNADLERLIAASGSNRRNYYRHLWELTQTTFNPEYLEEWTKHYSCFLPNENLTRFDSYIRQRRNFALSEITRAVPPEPFRISTRNETNVNETSTDIEGYGWLDVSEIQFADGGTIPLKWIGWNRWQAKIPVSPGLNQIEIEALDRWGKRIGSDTVVIIGTGSVLPAARDNVAISELMYHPKDPNENERSKGWTDAESFEFIELLNTNPEYSIDLGGTAFTQGIRYTLSNTLLGPGEKAVIAGNRAAFQARYGRQIAVVDEYQIGESNRLSNAGESLRFDDASGELIATVAWSDSRPWPTAADGLGYSLVATMPGTNSPSSPASWRTSTHIGGNPSASDSLPFGTWAQEFQTPHWDDDSDSDGWTAIWEYLTGSDPSQPDDIPTVQVHYDSDSNQLALDIVVRVGRDDAQVQPRLSLDLIEWTDQIHFHQRERQDDGTERIRFLSEVPLSEATAQYIRLDLDIRTGLRNMAEPPTDRR